MKEKELKKLIVVSAVTTFAVGGLLLTHAKVVDAQEEVDSDVAYEAPLGDFDIAQPGVFQPAPVPEADRLEEDDEAPEVSDTRRLQYIKQYVADRFTGATEEEINSYVTDLIKQLEESKRTPADGEDSSYDDLTKPGDNIIDVVVEEGPEPGEKASSYDDKTKLGDEITEVHVSSADGEDTSYDDLTKLGTDITDVVVEEGPKPGDTTPSYDDKTKLADDVIDVFTEEGPKSGGTVPSYDDKTKLADDVIDVVIDEESKTDEETAKTSEDSTKQSTDEKLPETGEVSSTAIFSAAALSILAGLGLVAPVSKKED